MKTIAVIPARLNSVRLNRKMMQDLGGIPLIRRTYENALQMQLFDQVLVATDSQEIFDEIAQHGGSAVMTSASHETGSDRIAQVVKPLDVDLVVNIQGDEPFIKKEPLAQLIAVFEENPDVDVATLKMHLTDRDSISNPNNVKVICDKDGNALYFSRTPLPYRRETEMTIHYFQHIGVYAYTKNAIERFSKLPMLELEKAEKIECLRYLEYGMKIKVVETEEKSIGIDTQEDLEKARDFLKQRQ